MEKKIILVTGASGGIGDNILECDGKTLKIVEDYVEEVEEILHCVS